jgi:CelD/BcsL family acetyltransferase involved in cellulose biosynthesis
MLESGKRIRPRVSAVAWRDETVDAARVPRRLFADWGRLAERCRLPLVAGPHWMDCFQRAFVAPGRGLVHALYRGDRLVAAVPLLRAGRLSRVLASMENDHSPIWTFALDTTVPLAAERLLDGLIGRADWLLLDRLRRSDPACTELARVAGARGLGAVLCEYSGDTSIDLGRSFDDLMRRWSPHVAKQTRRRLRLRAARPDLTVERVGDAAALPAILNGCFALEASTWKGDGGTAIDSDPEARAFYHDLAGTMAARGALALYLLRSGEHIVAFDYGVRGAGRLDSLKIAFDPAHAQLSPGNLLTVEMLRREIDEGEIDSVHLGRPSPHKARFATSVEPVVSLRIYGRGIRARAAYLTGPVLHGRLKQVPWLAALHRRGEALGPSIERIWRRLHRR